MVENSNTNCSSEVDENEELGYPSAGILLDTIRNEYKRTEEINKTLEWKVTVFFTLMLAFFGYIVKHLVKFETIINKIRSDNELYIGIWILITFLLVLIVLVLSAIAFIRVLWIRGYDGIDLDELVALSIYEEDQINQGLMGPYLKVVKSYRNKNENKARSLELGILCFIISFVLFMFSGIYFI